MQFKSPNAENTQLGFKVLFTLLHIILQLKVFYSQH